MILWGIALGNDPWHLSKINKRSRAATISGYNQAMSDAPIKLVFDLFDAQGLPVGPRHAALGDELRDALAQAQSVLGAQASGALVECRISRDGFETLWARARARRAILTLRQTKNAAAEVFWDLLEPRALSFMADYGGAWAWDALAVNIEPGPGDLPGATLEEARALSEAAQRWQLHFETRVFQDDEADDFQWGPFESAGRALALRASALTPAPVFFRQAWENRQARIKDELLCPVSWGALDELARAACDALTRFDQEAFVAELASGARQSQEDAMPWASYCAHWGLAQALRELARLDPKALSVGGVDGCAAAEAAFFSGHLDCLGIALSAGPWTGLTGTELCAQAASMARAMGAVPVIDGLKALAGAGVCLDGADLSSQELLGAAGSEVWIWTRAHVVGSQAGLGKSARAKRM